MSTQQNIQQTKKLFDEIYSKGHLNLLNEFFDSHIKLRDPAAPGFKGGLSEYKERETMYKNAFPNKQLKIDDIFAVDDKVVATWTCTGAHKGELQGISPTNKSIKVTGITIFRFDNNGKVTEITQSWDRLGLLEQIGEIEPSLALHR